MKKINKVVACLLGTALTFAGYASTPKSKAYLQTPIGDGSESGFVMNTTLPDGTTREMHLFKTGQEMNAFASEIGLDLKKWHKKFDASAMQLLKSFSKKAKFNEDGYVSLEYSFDDVGEIGRVMKEKGLPGAINAFKNGKEWRRVEIIAQNKKYSSFRFSVIDYIDEETYQARLAAQRAAEEEERRKNSERISQKMMRLQEEQQRQEQEWEDARRQSQANYQKQNKENAQQQKQRQQANSRNSPEYHDKNSMALESYFTRMNVNKGGSASLVRSGITSAELARYEQLIESGVSSSAAAQQVYNEFRK